jgi:hypothetical protein
MSDSVTKWFEMQEEGKLDKAPNKKLNMSKMKEIDEVAQGIADVTKELMYDSIHWQIAEFHVEGDSYNDLHAHVMALAIEKMWNDIQTKHDSKAII